MGKVLSMEVTLLIASLLLALVFAAAGARSSMSSPPSLRSLWIV